MKKLLFFLLTIPFLFTACSEDEVPMFGSVYGVVSDSATGQPISGAAITLSPGNFTYVTGSDGHYQFSDLEAGSYKVNCLANGYNANSRQITIYAGGNSTCDFLLVKQASVSGITLSTNSIDFGNKLSEQVFSIINTGNSGEVSWTISNTASWISVTPVSGSVAQGKSSSVTVKIDRSKITQDETSYITVNAAGGSLAVMVTVNCNNGGNGDNGANGSGEAVLGFDTTTLDFGTTETELSFIVANMDEATANLRWEIDSDYHQWLSVSKTSGELEPGYYHTVTVTLNRAAMTSSFETKLKVYDLAENYEYYYPITVTATIFSTESVESISLNKATATLVEGETLTLIPEIKPDNATNKNVTWSSSNTSVATVVDGKVTALKAGNTTITVTTADGGNTATCYVTVTARYYAVTSVSLNATSIVLAEGENYTLNASFQPSNATNKNVFWDCSDTSVVSVVNGRITALKPGTAIITVTTEDGGKTATCKVTVEDYSSATVTSCDYRVDAKISSCKRNGSTVVFTYKLTNIGLGVVNDWRIYPTNSISLISGSYRSIVYDDLGTEYYYSLFSFRNQSSKTDVVGTAFPEDMPCTGSVTVYNVDEAATKLTIMLGVYAYQYPSLNLADTRIFFKNVPIY